MSIISVEGNLGAGKSTLLSLLGLNTIKQPVDEWENTAGSNILERYYNDPKRWAFTFQLNALHSRSRLWQQAIKDCPDKVHFSERSPLADRNIFGQIMNRQGNFETVQYAVYDTLCRQIMSKLPLKGIIYLKCDPEVCLERIRVRNRKGEECLDLQYLKKVHQRHEVWIKRQRKLAVLTINTGIYDLDSRADREQIKKVISEFVEQLKNSSYS